MDEYNELTDGSKWFVGGMGRWTSSHVFTLHRRNGGEEEVVGL